MSIAGRKDYTINSVNIGILFIVVVIVTSGYLYKKRGQSFLERFTISLVIPVILAIWISWILPVTPNRDEKLKNLPEYLGRFALVTSFTGFVISLFQLPVSILRLGPRPAEKQTGIVVKMVKSRVQLIGVESAKSKALLIQLTWMSILTRI